MPTIENGVNDEMLGKVIDMESLDRVRNYSPTSSEDGKEKGRDKEEMANNKVSGHGRKVKKETWELFLHFRVLPYKGSRLGHAGGLLRFKIEFYSHIHDSVHKSRRNVLWSAKKVQGRRRAGGQAKTWTPSVLHKVLQSQRAKHHQIIF